MRSLPRLVLVTALVGAAAAAVGCAVYPPPGPPAPRISAEVALFWGDLAPFGDWVWLDVHGWVWLPRGVPAGWRPYTHGRWVHTVHGWTWASDWRWGWAPFHYGRWLWHRELGWVWVPGDEWAPAWVAWRYGPGWVGWAPLPPGVRWEVGVGFDLGGVAIDLGWWNFVRAEHFVDHRLRERVVPGDRDPELARVTREVTRYERGERGVVERSVPVEEIERETRQAVPRLRIEELTRPPRRTAQPIDGDRLRVYRPEARPGAPAPGARAESGAATGGEKKADDRERGASRTRPPKPPGG
jgi:hypothetical protein